MTATLGLEVHADRCAHGFHISQHPQFCGCQEMSEWRIFTDALLAAARGDRCNRDGHHVHQADVRPHIRGRIEPKHIGQQYRRAVREGLLRQSEPERSDDEAGRNAGRWEPTYEWLGAA